MSEQEWPAFRPEFEGHIGGYDDIKEDTDKANGERMVDLYGTVVRHIGKSKYRVWNSTNWALDEGAIALQCAQDLSGFMEEIELGRAFDGVAPEFPDDWSVGPPGAKPYRALLGKNGAITNAPVAVMAWASKSKARGEFIGERLKAEQADQLLRDLMFWIKRTKSTAGMNAAIRQFESKAGTNPDDFDRVRGTFTFRNGQLDTDTCELEPHRPEDLNTRLCPLDYLPGIKAPMWRNYLLQNQPDAKTRRYLQKLIGYALSGDANHKVIAFLYSEVSDTGKSVFLRVMEAAFGSAYAVSVADGTLSLSKNGNGGRNPDREDLRGKRLVIGSEFNKDEPMDEAFVKQITGGDGVNSRGNYSREGNKRWQPECLVMMATNHLMRISFDDEALWSRIRIVPWKIAFPLGHRDRDEKLADKIIANELAGVISWAVQGLKLYRSEGLDDIPPEVREATEKYKGQSDHVSTWLRHAIGSDDVREKAAGFSRISDLHAIASQWAKAAKVRDFPGIGAFNRRLQDLGYVFGPLPAKHIGKQQMKNSRVLQGLQVPAESISRHGIKE